MAIQTRERLTNVVTKSVPQVAPQETEEVSGEVASTEESPTGTEVALADLTHATAQENQVGSRRFGEWALRMSLRFCQWLLIPPAPRPRERTDIIFRR